MAIHVAEPGRPLGTRLPEAFQARRVADRGEPEAIRPSTQNKDRPVDPTRFDWREHQRSRRALEEYTEDHHEAPPTQRPFLAVSQMATSGIVRVSADTACEQAHRTMEERGIHHLVVEHEGKIAGLVDYPWLMETLVKQARQQTTDVPLNQLELPAFITVTPDTDAHQLAHQMLGYRLSAALVLDHQNRPMGVVTTTDFLRLFAGPGQFHETI